MTILKIECDSVHEIESGYRDTISVHLRNVNFSDLLQEIITNHGGKQALMNHVSDCLSDDEIKACLEVSDE